VFARALDRVRRHFARARERAPGLMLARLTLRLAAMPEEAWPRFVVAHAEQGTLPSPLKHAAAAALVSVLATGIGWALRPDATSGGAVVQMLLAVVGYVGGTMLAIELAPKLLGGRGQPSEEAEARFASGAVLPIALSGIGNLVPLPLMSLVLALAGTAASAHSGWVGASAMLALEGQARKRAAITPAGLAASPVLITTFVRMVMPA
jgi:hypothetical protein